MAQIKVGDLTPRNQYTASSGQTAFSYAFPIFADADLKVYVGTTLKTLTTDYTVSGAGDDNGGTVTLVTGATTGDIITILRDMPIARTSDYQVNGDLLADTLNDDLDKLVMMAQQNESELSRKLGLQLDDEDATMTLPLKDTRATKMMGFDSNGDVTVTTKTISDIEGIVDIISSSTTGLTNVLSIAALRLLGSAIDDNDSISVLGYYAEGDGGGGTFFWDASSTATDNGGTIIKATSVTTGRWIRVYDDAVSVKWFGAKGDGSTDDTAAIQAAIDAVSSVIIPAGTFMVDTDASTGTLKFQSNTHLSGIGIGVSILKSIGNSKNSTRLIRIVGGPSASWHTGRIKNCSVSQLTVDGNRDNKTWDNVARTGMTTAADGVTTASSTTITTASSFFASGDVNSRLRIKKNDDTFNISNIAPDASDSTKTTVTLAGAGDVGHTFEVGDIIKLASITGSGDYTAMNGQNMTVLSIVTDFLDVARSINVSHEITTGSYTSGGTATGGEITTRISSYVSATEVVVTDTMKQTATGVTLQMDTGEHNMGVEILGADNVVIRDVVSKNHWGDGIYMDVEYGGGLLATPKNITIDNVVCDNNMRQGMSIVGAEFMSVSNSYFQNTNGTGPAAGVDLEPDSGLVRFVSFNNCTFRDNDGAGLTAAIRFHSTSSDPYVGTPSSYGTWGIKISDCFMYSNKSYGVSIGHVNNGISITGCAIQHNLQAGIRVIGTNTGNSMGPIQITGNNISYNYFHHKNGDAADDTDSSNGHGIVSTSDATAIRMYSLNISSNVIAWNDGHGVYSSGLNYDDVMIHQNHITANGQHADDTYSGINVDGDFHNGLNIANNIISKSPGAHPFPNDTQTKFPKYGIDVPNHSNSNATIINNDVSGAGKTANINGTTFWNNKTNSGSYRKYVYANTGFVSENEVISSATGIGSTGTKTVTVAHGCDFTPKKEAVTLSFIDDIGGTPISSVPDINYGPILTAIDATNLTIKFNVASAGTGNILVLAKVSASNWPTS